MIESNALHEDKIEECEKISLVRPHNSWTKMDKLLMVFGTIVHIGDGVEIYLPGLLN